MIVVGEAVEGVEDGVGIVFAVEKIVEVACQPYLFEFVGHSYIKEGQCVMASFFDFLADDL